MYQSLHPEYQLAEIRERHSHLRRQAEYWLRAGRQDLPVVKLARDFPIGDAEDSENGTVGSTRSVRRQLDPSASRRLMRAGRAGFQVPELLVTAIGRGYGQVPIGSLAYHSG